VVAAPTSVQVFGRKDSRPTQAAIRFFRERRIPVSLVDVAVRPPAATELRRFAQRLGPRALLDVDSKAYRDQGLAYLSMDDEEVIERLLADPRLIRLPLVRTGDRFSAGPAEDAWKSWLAS
jgi:arsenate reductase-like glutaredoxin family protein